MTSSNPSSDWPNLDGRPYGKGADGDFSDWPCEAGLTGFTEERGPIELPVTGHIPAWAAGSLFRTGPGGHEIEDTPKGTYCISHWFDGLGHAHRFDIVPMGDDGSDTGEGGKVRVIYTSRRQCDELVRHIRRTGSGVLFSFAQRQDPCVGLFGKLMATFQRAVFGRHGQIKAGIENIAVNIVSGPPASVQKPSTISTGHRSGSRPLWFVTDNSIISEVDPVTLARVALDSQDKLHPELVGPFSCAHPARDHESGDIFNFNLQLGSKPTYRVFAVRAATGETEILATFSHPTLKPTYMHSFFLTENHVILCLSAAHLGMNGASVLVNGNVMDSIVPFDKEARTMWVFIDRTDERRGVVSVQQTRATFYFHTINAYEEDVLSPGTTEQDDENPPRRRVTCDMVEYPSFDILRGLYYDTLLNRSGTGKAFWGDAATRANALPSLGRYVFDLPSFVPGTNQNIDIASAGIMSTDLVERALAIPSPRAGELPIVNPARASKHHRYVWSLGSHGVSPIVDTIVKTDMDAEAAGRPGTTYWRNPRGHTPGEAIFIPRPPDDGGSAQDEDDGCLLSVVLDGIQGTSYLVCLDAKTMVELGRAECGFPVGLGFHGVHVSGNTGHPGEVPT